MSLMSGRKWQNSKHASRSVWVQRLKDMMKNAEYPTAMAPMEVEPTKPCAGRDVEPGDGDKDLSASSDGIPDGWANHQVVEYDGSSSPLTNPEPERDPDSVVCPVGHQNKQICFLVEYL